MTGRADGLVTGPQDPVVGSPERRPGSIRRTTSLDELRLGPEQGQRIVGVGRDLLTRADGTTEVVDEVRLQVEVDPLGAVAAIAADPPEPALDGLVGGSIRKGLRPRMDVLVPDHRAGATVLHQLLDDLPMAQLISGYGSSREQPTFRMPLDMAEGMADLCAGWERGGTMLGHLGATGIFPIPVGPDAPSLDRPGDPEAWHGLPDLERRSVRRRRRIDVAPRPDGGFDVDVHFRDSHLGLEGPEDVLHEYRLDVAVDADLVVRSSVAHARVLPWPECPGSLGSAGRAVGIALASLRPLVTRDFTGTSTCTHLNDSLRSLAGVAALVRSLG